MVEPMIETPKTDEAKRLVAMTDPSVRDQEAVPFWAVPADVCAAIERDCSGWAEQAIIGQQQIQFEREARMAAETNEKRYRWFRAYWLSKASSEELGEDFLKAGTDQEFDAAVDSAMRTASGAASS